ncbi:beta-galactosidase [Jiangella ureilytica]|uniref:beta-galactosidase n=1 Tax=Jiangella ureilytica TaxID=2530374 RepID=UPI00193DF95C|nr:beta-galactosidase [Jiangella ureilytica]
MSPRPWNAKITGIAFGGDYNPEQWPEEVWADDVRLMKDAGVTMVSVGIFSWAVVQPEPDRFEFATFDRVLDTLADAGIVAGLATMTASPPPWLARLHPETLPVTADGVTLWPGGRQHYCPSSPVYRRYAGQLVERVAQRYGDHPALAEWHIGNEYGCHVSRCWCDVSAADFRVWLQRRYGDVDGLNEAWSTTFWSQRYSSFEEVQPPRSAPTFPNPAQEIDFTEFGSDALLACYLMEKEIVGRITPDVPVTTNFIPMPRGTDPFAWAPHQDVVSYDSYPDPYDPDAHVLAGFGYDLMRSLRHGQPWMLMEQAPGAVNWRPRNSPKPPGLMRLWSWQAVAQGADAVLYFQWRQSRGGAEKFHSAMVPHGGEHTRGFQEVRELGAELRAAAEVAGGRSTADVALVMDWRSWWGLQRSSHPAVLEQFDAITAHYAPLLGRSVAVDVVPPSRDLSAYKLVVVPNLYLVSEADAARLTAYVDGGGHLLMSFFSGIVDEYDRVHLGGYPAPFRDVLGLRVAEFWPLEEGGTVDVELAGTVTPATVWSEIVEPAGAEVVGTFASSEPAGGPAVTRNAYGTGVAWYVGTRLADGAMDALVGRVLTGAGVTPVLPGLPAGVQATVRSNDSGRYAFLLNHATATALVPVPAATALVGPAPSGGRVELPPRGVAVLRLEDRLS